jgi:phage terminase Nu1 subunit (DNA packaging protein)
VTRKAQRVAVPDAKIKSPPAGSVGVREYARRRTAAGHPISHTGIGKAIASGRIAAAVFRDEQGRPFIDPELADELLEQNTDPSAQRENRAGGAPGKPETAPLFHEEDAELEREEAIAAAADKRDGKEAPTAAYTRSRAARETFEAQLSRLRYLKETGQLVDAKAVRERSENVGTMVRDALRNIPARIAGELAAETVPARIEERLQEEIDRALEQLAELARPY